MAALEAKSGRSERRLAQAEAAVAEAVEQVGSLLHSIFTECSLNDTQWKSGRSERSLAQAEAAVAEAVEQVCFILHSMFTEWQSMFPECSLIVR
jgi:hypothetical protein